MMTRSVQKLTLVPVWDKIPAGGHVRWDLPLFVIELHATKRLYASLSTFSRFGPIPLFIHYKRFEARFFLYFHE